MIILPIKQCWNCDRAKEVSNTHIHCEKMDRDIRKLDGCVSFGLRSKDKKFINPPRDENNEDE